MQAGRELDALVAEKVMEWHIGKIDDDWCDAQGRYVGYTRGTCCSQFPVFSPSTDIAAAWQVVDKMQDDLEWEFAIQAHGKQWLVFVSKRISSRDYDAKQSPFEGMADTAPLAICLAALEAIGVIVG